jgi:hypothetical protein
MAWDDLSIISKNYFTGPLAPASALGVTIALNRRVVTFGQVLAVTVIVLLLIPGLPLLSNSAVTKPVPPTGIGSCEYVGTVHPQEGWALWMISGA